MTTELYKQLDEVLTHQDMTVFDKLSKICEVLKSEINYYDWVGFYFAEHDDKTLHLGPFAGEPTDHKVIPFGKGICGQVAESNSTFLVEDVHAQDNYIACSLTVKSEIVVPLFLNGKNIGQIDIDSNTKNAFSEKDDEFLSHLNEKISVLLKDSETNLKSLYV
jgi:GAF domain-containing protein